MQKRYRVRYLSLVMLLFLFIQSPALGENSIRIGVVGAMDYSYGKETWNGALMAAEEINRRGGVRVGQERRPIELIVANSKEFLNVEYAINTMEMLFFWDNVDFIIGGFRSEAVLAMQDVAMDHKKLFISVGAALPELCQRVARNYDRYKYYFRSGTFNSNYLAQGCFLQLNYVANILREKTGLKKIKVVIAAEKAIWVEGMIAASREHFPKMGLELVGIYRPSSVATNVGNIIRAIENKNAPLVLTLFSSNVGSAFVTQAADRKLPVLLTGINVEAQHQSFWKATEGKANYVVTMSSYCKGVEMSLLTKPFLDNYMRRFGDLPTMSAESYAAIYHCLVPAIEQAGTLDSDKLVATIENNDFVTPRGVWGYDRDDLGRPLHDLKFGSKYALVLGIQWIDGKMKGIWPNKYVEKPGAPPLTYKGIVDLQIPPAVLEKYKQ